MIETRTTKDGREIWQCHSCKRWFIVKKGNKVDALGILENGDMKLQCIGCSGGWDAVTKYLKTLD